MASHNAEPPTAALPLLSIAVIVALVHLLTNNRYGFHPDELQFLERRPSSRLGIRRLSPLDAISGAHWSRYLRRLTSRAPALLSRRTVTGYPGYRADGAGTQRRPAGPGCRGACDCALTPAAIPGHRVPIFPIHHLRLSVVGTDCLLRNSLTKDVQSALVDGDRSGDGSGPPDQVRHCVFHRRDTRRRLVLGRNGSGNPDLPAEPRLASAPWIRLTALPASTYTPAM